VPETPEYPGERLGLPADGSGSVASYGRRIAALMIDWITALLVASVFVGGDVWTGEGAGLWLPLVVLLVELTLLDGLLGFSIGRRALSIAVVRVDGHKPVGLRRALVRSALLCLAVPAIVLDQDRRGLHDIAGGTVVVNM
jgi:uncharacterized RDD family membrane protein YckC